MQKEISLVTGALGQIGSDLVSYLAARNGKDSVIATDIKDPPADYPYTYEKLDVLDKAAIHKQLTTYSVNTVYHLAAMLSATAEKYPQQAWHLNIDSLLHFLELAKEGHFQKLFWPSSIAVFGKDAPRDLAPQDGVLTPTTVYGISKVAGELWGQYYFDHYGVDIRSLRYPGLISWKAQAGGGTTDYAVEIFHEAKKKNTYDCYLKKDTYLPMLYMDDAVKATVALMELPKEKISIRSSYNMAGMSISPQDIVEEIQKHIPTFKVEYKPDFRQAIADSWPESIDDYWLKKDLNYIDEFNLSLMVKEMLSHIA